MKTSMSYIFGIIKLSGLNLFTLDLLFQQYQINKFNSKWIKSQNNKFKDS